MMKGSLVCVYDGEAGDGGQLCVDVVIGEVGVGHHALEPLVAVGSLLRLPIGQRLDPLGLLGRTVAQGLHEHRPGEAQRRALGGGRLLHVLGIVLLDVGREGLPRRA
jgi:hypothetical protein